MSRLTINDLRRIMKECAGEDEGTDLSEQSLEARFEELGYDSLALLETGSAIEREYGIKLPEDTALDARLTPRELLAMVNEVLSAHTP
jgi:act minimal PKS acyl carrier protein